ncbi:histone-lysine N-methyltransferase PRDM16-like isoform X1 [Daphnia pulex]|uniref:histone-lysine N-methyltransferase PRDM16-like isoform X1 n=1 Tax=Daphnia pulex TaxID=6669 RepID=UPI001EDF2B75|nr:histone-lysine N-methyltransferase PRDM16-like isoform X1 [Daphnia pulex]XP_046438092.1 histone-lysine N-methyltransferase PRDM16-like isoform X1 [Daphnia pulex]XP_046438093.1 histone-lysine N-methyltransferase PRDM16-like isoform X1 [Daphnia pulex]
MERMPKVGRRHKWRLVQEKGSFACSLCPYSNDLRHRLKEHYKKVHDKTIGDNECCGISFTSKEDLKNHISTSHLHKYKCPDCDKNFTSKFVLKNHQNFVHGDSKEFKCTLCEYETNYKNGLKNHMKHKHGKRSKYMQYGSVFVKNKSLKQNAATRHHQSTTSNRYQCDMCDLNFKYPSLLLRHRNMHTKEFKCTLCKYSAARMAILMKHMKMHESDDEQSSSSTVIDNSTPSSENREQTDVEEEPIGFSRNNENEIKEQDPPDLQIEDVARPEPHSSLHYRSSQENITDLENVVDMEVRSDDSSSPSSVVGVEPPDLHPLSSSQSRPVGATPSHRLNSIQEEARQLRTQISPSTTLSGILSLLERLLELSASTTIEIRDSVKFEMRSQAIECFEYLWSASKMAVCVWEDIEGSMESNPSLKAVQYAYELLPTFIKWHKIKHLEMVGHIILLSINTVKNSQHQASLIRHRGAERKRF